MYLYKDLNKRRELVRKYLRNNPSATYIQIRNDTKIKIERVYPGGMKESYKDAGVPFSKALLKRSKEERRKLVVDYIKKNPRATVTTVKGDLNIEIPKTFKTIENAYKAANIKYPRKPVFRHKEEKDKIKFRIINYIKENPLVSIGDLNKIFKVNLHKYFKSIKEIYKLAKIDYPKEKILQGAANPEVQKRAQIFENKVVKTLQKMGDVRRYVKINDYILDALFIFKDKKFIVEIKDSKRNRINSAIRQITNYLKALDHKYGIIVHNNKGEIDKVYKDNYEILIIPFNKLVRGTWYNQAYF